jgi:hypothetical protein
MAMPFFNDMATLARVHPFFVFNPWTLVVLLTTFSSHGFKVTMRRNKTGDHTLSLFSSPVQ